MINVLKLFFINSIYINTYIFTSLGGHSIKSLEIPNLDKNLTKIKLLAGAYSFVVRDFYIDFILSQLKAYVRNYKLKTYDSDVFLSSLTSISKNIKNDIIYCIYYYYYYYYYYVFL